MVTRNILLVISAFVALAPAIDVGAQATEPQGTAIIAVDDIPDSADADDAFAQNIIARVQDGEAVETLESQLATLAQTVHVQSTRFNSTDLRLVPVLRLESLSRHWRFLRRQLQEWREELNLVSAPYLDDAATLARKREIWSATRDSPGVQNGPTALRERISTLDGQFTRAEEALSGPLERHFRLGQRATTIEVEIEASARRVASAVSYSDRRLTRIDSPPLWQMDRDARRVGPSADQALGIEMTFVEDYVRAKRSFLRSYQVLELALLPLLIWLKLRLRNSGANDPQTQAAARVLNRPIASWALLVLSSVLVVESDAPILVHQVVLFLALVPVLRLLPPRVYEVLGPWPYVISVLYLLDLAGSWIADHAVIHRWYLLGMSILLVGLLAGFLIFRRAQRNHARPHSNVVVIARIGGWIVALILAVAIVSNVVGNVTLSQMLVSAVIFSAYVGLVLYAGVHVANSLLHLAMRRRQQPHIRVSLQYGGEVLTGLTKLVRVVAVVGWLATTLDQLRILQPIQEMLRDVLTHPFGYGDISVTLGGILLFCFAVWLAAWIAKAVRVILSDDILPTVSLPRGVAHSIATLTYYALIFGGLLLALLAAGFNVGQLTIVLGALGVGIGLGLQGVVNNFVSGLILMFERPIQPGDIVEISGTAGKVREIGMRATTLATFDGGDVVVPNGTVLSEKLTNWTLTNMSRSFDVNVAVALKSETKLVFDLLLETVRSTPGVAAVPAPVVTFVGFVNGVLEFKVSAWTNDLAQLGKTRSDVTWRVHDALVGGGIEIPLPQRDLNLRTISPEAQAAFAANAQQPLR